MPKEKDIFGGTNTGLINAGKEAVRIAKQAQAEKKAYSKKEINQAIKSDLCGRIRFQDRRTISTVIPEITHKLKKDPEADVFAPCRTSWAEKFGANQQHINCGGSFTDGAGKLRKCACSCHKKKKKEKCSECGR